MTLFWMLGAAMVLLALLFVVVPLWRKNVPGNEVLRDAANLEILRDQSAEMSADLAHGLLNQESFEQGQHELQTRLLEEVKTTQIVVVPRNPAKILALVLAVLIPLASVSLYWKLGSKRALSSEPAELGVADGFGIIHSELALQDLEKKLEKSPNNPDRWLQLARSYAELKRYTDATRAYAKLAELVPDESQVWTDYADAYAMDHGQTLLGEPTKFLNKALALDANNTTALALSGSAAMERGDYVAAITHWQKLIGLLPPEYPELQLVRDGVQQARDFLAMQKGGKEKLAQLPKEPQPKTAQPPATRHAAATTGKVSLSPELVGKVAPTDTVFILARAVEGPKMPLAVLRKQVKDLPLTFSLDDSMAMQPQLKLSGFAQVVVVARVSKGGTPMAQAGDVQGTSAAIKPGATGLNIVIDSVVK